MYCEKCGAFCPDGAIFCEKCGASLSGASAQNQQTQPSAKKYSNLITDDDEPETTAFGGQPAQQPFNYQSPYNQIPVNQAQNGYNPAAQPVYPQTQDYGVSPNTQGGGEYVGNYADINYTNNTPNGKKAKKSGGKKGKKALKVLIAVVVIVIVLGVAGIFSWVPIARAATGELDFYLWRESSTIVDIFNTDALREIWHTQDFKSDTDASAKATEGSESADFSSEITMSYDKDKHTTVASGNIESKQLQFDEGLTFNYKDGQLCVTSPDDTEKQLNIDLSALLGSGNAKSSSSDDKNSVDYENAVKIFADIIKQAEKETVTGDMKSTKIQNVNGRLCTVVTLKVTEKDMTKFGYEFLSRALKDKDAKAVIENVFKQYYDIGLNDSDEYSSAEDFADEVLDELEDSLDDMKDEIDDSDDDEPITIYVSYDLFGNIMSRGFSYEYSDESDDSDYKSSSEGKTQLDILSKTSGGSTVITAEYTSDYSDESTSTSSDYDSWTGSYNTTTTTSKSKGKDSVTVNYDVTTGESKLNGSIDVKVSDEYSYETDNSDDDYSRDNVYKFNIDLKDLGVEKLNGVNTITGEFSLDGDMGDYSKFNLKINGENKDKYNVSFDFNLSGSDSSDKFTVNGDIDTELTDKPDVSGYKEPDDSKSADFSDFVEDIETHISNQAMN